MLPFGKGPYFTFRLELGEGMGCISFKQACLNNARAVLGSASHPLPLDHMGFECGSLEGIIPEAYLKDNVSTFEGLQKWSLQEVLESPTYRNGLHTDLKAGYVSGITSLWTFSTEESPSLLIVCLQLLV